jgi:hypothetical protein
MARRPASFRPSVFIWRCASSGYSKMPLAAGGIVMYGPASTVLPQNIISNPTAPDHNSTQPKFLRSLVAVDCRTCWRLLPWHSSLSPAVAGQCPCWAGLMLSLLYFRPCPRRHGLAVSGPCEVSQRLDIWQLKPCVPGARLQALALHRRSAFPPLFNRGRAKKVPTSKQQYPATGAHHVPLSQ